MPARKRPRDSVRFHGRKAEPWVLSCEPRHWTPRSPVARAGAPGGRKVRGRAESRAFLRCGSTYGGFQAVSNARTDRGHASPSRRRRGRSEVLAAASCRARWRRPRPPGGRVRSLTPFRSKQWADPFPTNHRLQVARNFVAHRDDPESAGPEVIPGTREWEPCRLRHGHTRWEPRNLPGIEPFPSGRTDSGYARIY